MGGYSEVNIKYDMPTASQAVKRATYAIENARRLGLGCVKLIHGYGSHGAGGKIRLELRAYLGRLERQRRIAFFIPGEDFSIFSEPTRSAFTRCPDLRKDPDLDRSNNGVTIVVL